MKLLALWFGLRAPVSRKAYALSGLALMALKIALDNGLALLATGKAWPPAAYLLPSLALKSEAMRPVPSGVLLAMALSTLPFMWVGVTMTVRRAADAGASPWWGLLFLVPLFNYLVMVLFAVLPATKKEETRWVPVQLGPFRTSPDAPPASEVGPVPPGLRSALLGVAASVGLGLGMLVVSVYSMQLYGAALFFGTPFGMGLMTALFYNHKYARGLSATLGLAVTAVLITGLAFLLFAIEGLLCIAMAAPIAIVLAVFGALLGWAMTRQGRRPTYAMVLALPALAGVEAKTTTPTLREVTTSIEIDAPPEAVWPNVVGFSELPPPPQWFFRLGIAYPQRARIEGSGVGAVRRCEFSTGPFVEPITAWEPPRRLAFDVASQPPSMSELSPYRQVHAPHLEGYMVSRKGEFRLVPLPGGRTRLEGSTWYTLSIFPEGYWVVWGEGVLHEIHGRVLSHIKDLSEHPGAR